MQPGDVEWLLGILLSSVHSDEVMETTSDWKQLGVGQRSLQNRYAIPYRLLIATRSCSLPLLNMMNASAHNKQS